MNFVCRENPNHFGEDCNEKREKSGLEIKYCAPDCFGPRNNIKKKDKLIKVYPCFLLNDYFHNYSAASVGDSVSVAGASTSATGASVVSSAFFAFPPRRLFAFLTSFLPPL